MEERGGFQDKIESKLDSLMDAVKMSIDTNTQMLAEVRRVTDVFQIHSSHMEKENNRIWSELQDEKISRKRLGDRVDKLEVAVATMEVKILLAPDRASTSDMPNSLEELEKHAMKWFQSKLGKLFLSTVVIALTAIITRLVVLKIP